MCFPSAVNSCVIDQSSGISFPFVFTSFHVPTIASAVVFLAFGVFSFFSSLVVDVPSRFESSGAVQPSASSSAARAAGGTSRRVVMAVLQSAGATVDEPGSRSDERDDGNVKRPTSAVQVAIFGIRLFLRTICVAGSWAETSRLGRMRGVPMGRAPARAISPAPFGATQRPAVRSGRASRASPPTPQGCHRPRSTRPRSARTRRRSCRRPRPG